MLVEANVWTVAHTDHGNAVLIRPIGSEVAVPIFIGAQEAQAILLGLGNVATPRPLTHDLFASVLKNLGVTVERVEINALKDDTFFANLILNIKGNSVTIDARPSDSIALAVRTKCPIFIAEDIVDTVGYPISMITSQVSDTEKSTSEIDKLKKELEQAIGDENYEEAARIRDLLSELGGDVSNS
ncbi:MAG: hypothetical protein E4H36_11115 [Spirochaetales bacterium]|nr:MAG: hypothetical protein E4H36_11115 [Spirochaetales bacterium]